MKNIINLIMDAGKKTEETFWKGIVQPRGETNARCRFQPMESGKPCPIFKLTIEENWSIDAEPMSKLTVIISVDDNGQNFVSRHPVWSKDCRPFLLWQIYEAFWSLKFAEAGFGAAKMTEINHHDSRLNVTTTILIAAEVFFPSGSPVISVVNYANTHIYDQLKAIYKQHPEAAPSSEWITSTTSEIVKQDALRKLASEREVELARHSRRPPTAAITLFVDEAGDLGFKEPGHYYLNFGVLIKDENLELARKMLTGLLVKHWTGIAPKEIHFGKLPEAKRDAIMADLVLVFQQCVEQASCFAMHNLDFLRHLLRCEAEFNRGEEVPSTTNIADLLASPDGNAGRKLLILSTEELISHIGIEWLADAFKFSIVHDHKRSSWMNDALQKGFVAAKSTITSYEAELYGEGKSPAMHFSTSHSELEPCLWLSDWLAWEFGNWLRGGDLSSAFEKIRDKIKFYGYGVDGIKVVFDGPGGAELGKFPDRPRKITQIV